MKIGIITLYHQNNNYGGMAQAYALQQYLTKLGHDSQVIDYCRTSQRLFEPPTIKRNIIDRLLGKFKRRWIKQHTKQVEGMIRRRETAMQKFRNEIVHTKKTYTDGQIGSCIDEFDVFISGSDQIWKPSVVRGPFVLDFVGGHKPKIAYAASIAQRQMPKGYGEYMKKHLKTYHGISVREREAKEYLSGLLDREVGWVVDPVFLLTKEEWERQAGENPYHGKYIFCYYLGDSVKVRIEAIKFSEETELPIVTMPYLQGKWRSIDESFGDEKIMAAQFSEFLALIRDAAYVLTDSFHAVAFSHIFNKEYYVFPRIDRESNEDMNSRINSLLNLIDNAMLEEKITYSKQWLDDALASARTEQGRKGQVKDVEA